MGDIIKLTASEPEKCYIEQLEEKEKLLNRNLEKQKGLYEVYSEDKINIDIYNGVFQLMIIEKRNSANLIQLTQDFLLRLKNTSPIWTIRFCY